MRILGIDPGSLKMGIGVIDHEGDKVTHVHSGFIDVHTKDFPDRLRKIYTGVGRVVAEFQPEEIAVEKVFMQRNADSALKLGQARAAAICGCFINSSAPVLEYTPREIKQAVVGKGGSGKEQVQHMVGMLLKLDYALQADEADALAVALCHAFSRDVKARLRAARDSQE
ncbi:MAG: crossover junction endodeoxyribonuclease RuvC [Gammaproteobacteria bacterium]